MFNAGLYTFLIKEVLGSIMCWLRRQDLLLQRAVAWPLPRREGGGQSHARSSTVSLTLPSLREVATQGSLFYLRLLWVYI